MSTTDKTQGWQQTQRHRWPAVGNRQGGEAAQVFLQRGLSEKQELQRKVGGGGPWEALQQQRGSRFSPALLPTKGGA